MGSQMPGALHISLSHAASAKDAQPGDCISARQYNNISTLVQTNTTVIRDIHPFSTPLDLDRFPALGLLITAAGTGRYMASGEIELGVVYGERSRGLSNDDIKHDGQEQMSLISRLLGQESSRWH